MSIIASPISNSKNMELVFDMKVSERSFGGKLFRPKPEVFHEDNGNIVIIATPWGPRSSAQKAVQHIVDFIQSSRDDSEVTSPFERLTCLTPLGNNLRVALMLTNDMIYQEENREEYRSGLEMVAIAKTETELVFAQIGAPHVFIDRPGLNLSMLQGASDFSLLMSPSGKLYPPLPSQLLGLHTTSNFVIHSLRPYPTDRLVLLSRSTVPPDFYSLPKKSRDLESLTEVLAQADENSPFWLGVVDF